jgi:hypothetical protein
MPGSRLTVFDGAGPFPFRQDPARFAEAVLGFMDQTQPAPYSSAQWRALLRQGPEKPLAH